MSPETAEVRAEATAQSQTFGTSRPAPGQYTLSFEVGSLALRMDDKECCFGDVYDKLRDSTIKEFEEGSAVTPDKYVTEASDVHVTGGWTERALLHDLLELARKGIDPFCATWFPYDSEVSRDAVVVHTFFVLHAGKIVDESFSFSEGAPLVLRPGHMNTLERREEPHPLSQSRILRQRVCVLLVPQVLYRDDHRAAHGPAA